MIYQVALVGLGGGVGSILRFLLQRALNGSFPYGTFVVNLAGCLLIGLLWGAFARTPSDSGRLLLMTGFCGGFTTFSAFTQESIGLLLQDKMFPFALYAFASVAGGLLATYFGFKLTHT